MHGVAGLEGSVAALSGGATVFTRFSWSSSSTELARSARTRWVSMLPPVEPEKPNLYVGGASAVIRVDSTGWNPAPKSISTFTVGRSPR